MSSRTQPVRSTDEPPALKISTYSQLLSGLDAGLYMISVMRMSGHWPRRPCRPARRRPAASKHDCSCSWELLSARKGDTVLTHGPGPGRQPKAAPPNAGRTMPPRVSGSAKTEAALSRGPVGGSTVDQHADVASGQAVELVAPQPLLDGFLHRVQRTCPSAKTKFALPPCFRLTTLRFVRGSSMAPAPTCLGSTMSRSGSG